MRENRVNQSGSVALSTEAMRGPPWRNLLIIMALLIQKIRLRTKGSWVQVLPGAPPIRITDQEVAAKPSRPPYFCYSAFREIPVNCARRRFRSLRRSRGYNQKSRPPSHSHGSQSIACDDSLQPAFRFKRVNAHDSRALSVAMNSIASISSRNSAAE